MDIILRQSDYKNVNICRHISANYVLSPGKVILCGIGMRPGFVILYPKQFLSLPRCLITCIFPSQPKFYIAGVTLSNHPVLQFAFLCCFKKQGRNVYVCVCVYSIGTISIGTYI